MITPDKRTSFLDDIETALLEPADESDEIVFVAIIEVIRKYLKQKDIWYE